MNLTAIFEDWHIGDGNYPPLSKGQAVNLSFEIEPGKALEEVDLDSPERFDSLGYGEYDFCAVVIRVYEDLSIFQSREFRFYIMSNEDQYLVGHRYSGTGTLLLDHYSWVEYVGTYENAPNLFYNLEVKRILKVSVPERFVVRHENGKSLPTRLPPSEYSLSDVEEVVTMEGQVFDEEFYIIEFNSTGVEESIIERTFRS